jgi:RNA chaperone Hfq
MTEESVMSTFGYQDHYLAKLVETNKKVVVCLNTGIPVKGRIVKFDEWMVFVEVEEEMQRIISKDVIRGIISAVSIS